MNTSTQLTIASTISQTFRFDPVELKVISSLPIPTEHEEQRALVSWWRKSLPDVRIFAIPNGGARGIKTASKLKLEGVSAGVPDLEAPGIGLYIEMKRQKGGSVSAEQKDWHQYLIKCGYTVLTPKGAAEAIRQITEYLERKKAP